MRIGALEAGGTKMVCAVGNELGVIEKRISIPTETPEITMPKLLSFFKEEQVEALGIGCFGPIDLNEESPTYGYITSTPKLAWQNYNICGVFREELKIPVGFDTDVNGSCLGELHYGNGKGLKSLVYITIGTGVGMGICADGKLVHGMMHPEAGHIMVKRHEQDTFEGACPFHGDCLEGLVAGKSIGQRYQIPAFELENTHKVWEFTAYYIAQAIVSMILTVSPQRVILGGGVMKQEHLMPMIRKEVEKIVNGYVKTEELKDMDKYIVAPGCVDDQGILGAMKLGLDAKIKEEKGNISKN